MQDKSEAASKLFQSSTVRRSDLTIFIDATKEASEIIIRGLRAVSDFEYEFQMFGMNSRLDPSIQTIFLPASESAHFIASRLVKEVARLGGDVSSFVSKNVAQELHKVFKNAQ